MNLALGKTISGRYQIVSQLGRGGFGTTFIAVDNHLPDKRRCVVKQLKPQATDSLTLEIARRLFDTEAQTLLQLGTHPQIPQLFAYFEEDEEFYLVQEYVEGTELNEELTPPQTKSETEVIELLQEILEILNFVHQHQVIHRDLNGRNIIRRKKDGKLVLIDFGAVKQVTTQVASCGQTDLTVAIGTPGYRPSEQANGNPQLSSDIYALGMLIIQALTGCSPNKLPKDPLTSEISWHEIVQVSPGLRKVLAKMVSYDYRDRYPTAKEALAAVANLTNSTTALMSSTLQSGNQRLENKVSLKKLNRLPCSWLSSGLLVLLAIAGGIIGIIALGNLRNTANSTNLYEQGKTFYELNRYDRALVAYQGAIAIRPDYAEAWKGQGDTLKSLEQDREALQAYEKAIQLQPDYWQAWLGRAEVLANLEEVPEAISAFEKVISLQPKQVAAWLGKGKIQMKLAEYSAAIATFERVLELQPDDAHTWYEMGEALSYLERDSEAVTAYDRALSLKPDSSQTWYSRGNALMNLSDYPQAINSFQQAVKFQPDWAQAWYNLATAKSKLGQYQQAIAAYDRVIQLTPNDYQTWYDRGFAFQQEQRYQEAIADYDRALEINTQDPSIWYQRGIILYNLERDREAIVSFEQATALQPELHQAWYNRGNALLRLQRTAEAIASYDKALLYKPNYPEASQAKERAEKQLLGITQND
ncbi:MAG: tetratricopeptide repeat protein [Kamptonema sp. SIO1D9]|nr:tetratricopeptide repeat protein [Kamptonema sp. SIO1D9]